MTCKILQYRFCCFQSAYDSPVPSPCWKKNKNKKNPIRVTKGMLEGAVESNYYQYTPISKLSGLANASGKGGK